MPVAVGGLLDLSKLKDDLASHSASMMSPLVCIKQYIVKPPHSPLSAFGWHRDRDWMTAADVDGHPYISVR